MNVRTAWLAAAVALGAPSPAAAEWTVVVANNAYFVEFNPDFVRRQGPYTMAWTRMTFTVPQRLQEGNGTKYQSQLQLHAIDCPAAASTVVGLVLYASALGQGEVIERTTRPRAEWSLKPAPPETIGDVTVRRACAAIAQRESQ